MPSSSLPWPTRDAPSWLRAASNPGDWEARLGRVRSGSALELLIEALPGAPVLTAQSAASLIGRS
jgi:hypothetical protein